MRLFAFLIAAPLAAQSSSIVSLSNGVQLRIGVGSASALKAELKPASGNSFYRIFRDQNGLAVFAYELLVERTPDGERFRIRALPAGAEFASHFPAADGGKPTPTLTAALESPLLPPGGRYTIEIPTDPGLKENLSDVAQVRVSQRGGPAASDEARSGERLRFIGLQVRINGRAATPPGAAPVVSGKYAMFYVPGRGGYFFATEPSADRPFARVGVVDGAHLRFTIDNDTFECDSSGPILLQSERGELWVFHLPHYKPKGNWTKNDPATSRDEFFAAAADSLNWWLP